MRQLIQSVESRGLWIVSLHATTVSVRIVDRWGNADVGWVPQIRLDAAPGQKYYLNTYSENRLINILVLYMQGVFKLGGACTHAYFNLKR